ncbi:hypothetical protein A2348_04755 [Candidatus Uhrbacteria bacterium RIFOXYB12_FULL_58_10]|uniref:Uncharacterized protein n=1 Tax=Candidatus Uhrbacteria bacterium RIFOXYB2_FULL_57_15 TaxID=1802422 RepID=A0A1F7W8L0_9BACT|nr:MAG: hypothetical protein A2348_04755 [Candidatus Uhrbacteria bacterium RIFOXYB12_FULL_58_10]OGL99141.1 MAG: hypothetical protein A2304_03235 [Candidatus Uhrbacteria bacterium RIFOXYB2_FULL_57_15]OGL99807.1 MAG: hypothetical protein A2501_04770 [Candidatus Uhrbacteria bacterium RIFOXYC12_FULL_57_11]
MNRTVRFDLSIDRFIRSQLFRLLYRVPKRDRCQALSDVWLILEGDYGGQIYLSVPWQCVARTARIGELLRGIDALCWGCNALAGASARLVRPRSAAKIVAELTLNGDAPAEVAAAFGFESLDEFVEANRMFVSGGMGGGQLLQNRLWLHDELRGRDIVVEGVQPLLDELRGATNGEIRDMDWNGQAMRLLSLQTA